MHDEAINIDFSKTKHDILVADEGRSFHSYFFPIHQAPPGGLGKMQDFFDICK